MSHNEQKGSLWYGLWFPIWGNLSWFPEDLHSRWWEVENQWTRQFVGDWVKGVSPNVFMSSLRLAHQIPRFLSITLVSQFPGWTPSKSYFPDHCWPFPHFLPQFIVPTISAIAGIRLNDSFRDVVKKYYLHPKRRGAWRDRKLLFFSQADTAKED